ncbi:hypothetical protein HNQ25_01845 [Pseudomonas sediminis]|uniref:Uncharacterized protein n=1 Tax=Pseudomonas sediminis TaxID=1691904 RepID=A0ABX6SI67_9PSED|nr:hypothetical protein HNQ25_01845 [Pseudomonas sediminis]
MRGNRAAAAPAHLLADSTFGGIALSEGHRFEAVTFAGTLAFAAVFGGFAIILAFAGRDAVTMYFGFLSHCYGAGESSEHAGSSEGDGSTSSSGGFHGHVRILG